MHKLGQTPRGSAHHSHTHSCAHPTQVIPPILIATPTLIAPPTHTVPSHNQPHPLSPSHSHGPAHPLDPVLCGGRPLQPGARPLWAPRAFLGTPMLLAQTSGRSLQPV